MEGEGDGFLRGHPSSLLPYALEGHFTNPRAQGSQTLLLLGEHSGGSGTPTNSARVITLLGDVNPPAIVTFTISGAVGSRVFAPGLRYAVLRL